MARLSLANLFRLILTGCLYASLSGCLIQRATGFVDIVPDENQRVQDVNAYLSSGDLAAVCIREGSSLTCTYVSAGKIFTPTVNLASLPCEGCGAFHDPLILEVPTSVITKTGTYDTGSGPQPLPISQADSFAVQPGLRITAEVGTSFLFLDLPISATSNITGTDPTLGPVFSYTLSLQQNFPISATVPPVTVKPMMAGRVTVLWQTYYVPLLPCVTDFASIPALTIPHASTPQDLEPNLLDLITNHGIGPCNHKVYDFSQAMPPPGLVFMPLVRR